MSLGMQPPVCRSSAFCQAHIRYSLKDASQWMPLGLPLPRSFLFAGQAGPLNEAVGPPDRHHGWPLASSFPAVRRHANAGLGGRRRSSMGVPWLFVLPGKKSFPQQCARHNSVELRSISRIRLGEPTRTGNRVVCSQTTRGGDKTQSRHDTFNPGSRSTNEKVRLMRTMVR